MKTWQIIVVCILFLAAAGAVVTFPPGSLRAESIFNDVSPSPTGVPATLLFVGDVMLSRSVGDTMSVRQDWLWPFRNVASISAAADLTFGNLETTISSRGMKGGCGYCFRADPRVVQGLTYAGFDIMSVANNHIHDYGPLAYEDTMNALTSAGIDPVGNVGAVFRDVNGTKLAFLAYTYPLNQARIIEDIGLVRPKADMVIISMHSGTEYEIEHNAEQERIYRSAIDAGADLIVGSHPHVVQELERYNGSWIAYSLGNFIFDQNWSAETMRGAALKVTIKDKKISGILILPVDISSRYQASFDD